MGSALTAGSVKIELGCRTPRWHSQKTGELLDVETSHILVSEVLYPVGKQFSLSVGVREVGFATKALAYRNVWVEKRKYERAGVRNLRFLGGHVVTRGPSSSAALPLKVNLEFSGAAVVRTHSFMAQGLGSVPD